MHRSVNLLENRSNHLEDIINYIGKIHLQIAMTSSTPIWQWCWHPHI